MITFDVIVRVSVDGGVFGEAETERQLAEIVREAIEYEAKKGVQ